MEVLLNLKFSRIMRGFNLKRLPAICLIALASIHFLPQIAQGQVLGGGGIAQRRQRQLDRLGLNERQPRERVPPPDQRPLANQPRGTAQLFRLLNLSPDQRAQMRLIRTQNADNLRIARQRLRAARVSLDQAIYADTLDEAAVDARTRELIAAQAELARINVLTELRVRRLLTPEQFNLFREMRRRAAQDMQQQQLNNQQTEAP